MSQGAGIRCPEQSDCSCILPRADDKALSENIQRINEQDNVTCRALIINATGRGVITKIPEYSGSRKVVMCTQHFQDSFKIAGNAAGIEHEHEIPSNKYILSA
jgi:hypothetical protein